MIINIRGTSGSGKSWVIKQLLKRFPNEYDISLLGHILNGNTYLIGPYLSQRGDVGIDILLKDMTLDGIQALALQKPLQVSRGLLGNVPAGRPQFEHVIFEGLIITSVYERYRKMSEEADLRWVFLNTPLETCLKQVDKRRMERGDRRPLNPENTVTKWNVARRHVDKARADGMKVFDISTEEAVELVSGWITKS